MSQHVSAYMLAAGLQFVYRSKRLIRRKYAGQKLLAPIRKLASHHCLSHFAKRPHIDKFMQNADCLTQDMEIHPNLEELIGSAESQDADGQAHINQEDVVAAYIYQQCKRLRNDFNQELQHFVKTLKTRQPIADSGVLTNVQITSNDELVNSGLQNGFLVDIIASKRKQTPEATALKSKEERFVQSLKIGSLLCLSTDFRFDDLVLATVCYTDDNLLEAGYICVHILAQEKIGNILKRPLIAFEAPHYFEPYQRVFNRLKRLNRKNFPMQEYIIEGKTAVSCTEFQKEKGPAITTSVDLNVSQKAAFDKALVSDFCLIQGPPGTGKTSVSVELARAMIMDAKRWHAGPVLLLTYTNEALDKFLMKLSEHNQNIARLGSQIRAEEIEKFQQYNSIGNNRTSTRLKKEHWKLEKVYEETFQKLHKAYTNCIGTQDNFEDIPPLISKMRKIRLQLNNIRIQALHCCTHNKDIIAMTTTYAAKSSELFKLLKIRTVIFEEAAEITEPHVIACLPPNIRRVIMIGDHKQLQPHTSQLVANNPLSVSLFERLINQGMEHTQLNVQYRMRRCIADLLVPDFFETLASDSSVDLYPSVRGMTKDLYFMTHNQQEIQEPEGYCRNDYEKIQLCQLLMHLLREGQHKLADIVVLTPYTAQVAAIRAELSIHNIRDIKVSTVDSFQGLEANIVLLSLVRSNEKLSIGFMGVSNRICVALSRAKHGLYIIGDMNCLAGSSSLWCSIESKLIAQDCIGSKFPIKKNSEHQ